MYKPEKIISGGQTGADKAGLVAARICCIKTGGTAPKGWRIQLPDGSEGIDAIFGFHTQQPLVEIKYPCLSKIQVAVDTARSHAQWVLEACESARLDSFWYKFAQKLDMSREEAAAVIQEYKGFRDRERLEANIICTDLSTGTAHSAPNF